MDGSKSSPDDDEVIYPMATLSSLGNDSNLSNVNLTPNENKKIVPFEGAETNAHWFGLGRLRTSLFLIIPTCEKSDKI